MRDAVLVDLALVLYDHVFFMDGFQESCGQRLEVGDGLRRQRKTAAVFFREQQFLHCAHASQDPTSNHCCCRRHDRAFQNKGSVFLFPSVNLTLFGGQNSCQCTAVGLPTHFRVPSALQRTLKTARGMMFLESVVIKLLLPSDPLQLLQ